MRMIRPKITAPQVTIAEDQEDYKTVTAAVVRHPSYSCGLRAVAGEVVATNGIVLAFRPSDEERAKIAAGSDIYVSLLTFNRPMQPVIVEAGPEKHGQLVRRRGRAMKLLLVDGTNIVMRCAFGGDIEPRESVTTATAMIERIAHELHATHLIIALDCPDVPTWRRELYPEYKAHRTRVEAA